MRRFYWYLGIPFALFVLFAIVFLVFQTQIVSALFAWGVRNADTSPPTDQLDDGLHIYVCGAGTPLYDPRRGGSCLGVVAGESVYIIDAGGSAARTLSRLNFPVSRLGGIFITHFHSDHIDGLGELLISSWIQGSRSEPTPIFGPEGVAQLVAGFNEAYRLDHVVRSKHHGVEIANIAGAGGKAITFQLTEELSLVHDGGDIQISAFPVDHGVVAPAVGYRIDYKGRSVVISGDTTTNWDASSFAKDVDLLIHSVLGHEMIHQLADIAKEQGNVLGETILHQITEYFSSPVEVAQLATRANVQELLFYHISPPLPFGFLESLFLKDVDEHYSRDFRLAEDGLLVSLPVDTDGIDYEYLF